MPNVIVKSRYFISKKHMSNYLNYISTREGVEILPDDVKSKKATVKQRQFIIQHKKGMEDLKEYKEYLKAPTIINASRAITAYAKREYGADEEFRKYAYKDGGAFSPEIRDSPATQKQKDWIEKNGKGLTDLLEYSDYRNNPTVGNASELISAISEYHITDSEIYVNYIANRPGVYKQKGAAHGLFTMNGKANLNSELKKIKASESVAWAHIISLRREDAERLGFETAESWRKIIAANAPQIAKLYNIDIQNLNILGAFHNEGHHPHVHLFVYSDSKSEGRIPKARMKTAGERMRSMFTNSIFSLDMQPLISKRNELRENISRRVKELSQLYGKKYEPDNAVTDSLLALSKSLPTAGKLQYAYLPAEVKLKVNDCLRRIVSADDTLNSLVSEYFSLQRNLIEKYNKDPDKVDAKYADFMEHFFEPRCGKYSEGRDITTLHNIIINCAAMINPPEPEHGNIHNRFNLQKPDGTSAVSNTPTTSADNGYSSQSNNYALKFAALSAVRLLAKELTDLCDTVDTCSRPVVNKRPRRRGRFRHRNKNISMEGTLR